MKSCSRARTGLVRAAGASAAVALAWIALALAGAGTALLGPLARAGSADDAKEAKETDFCSERCVDLETECTHDCDPGDESCTDTCGLEGDICRKDCSAADAEPPKSSKGTKSAGAAPKPGNPPAQPGKAQAGKKGDSRAAASASDDEDEDAPDPDQKPAVPPAREDPEESEDPD